MASEELQEELEALSCAELIRKLYTLFESEQEDDVDECLDWFLFTYSPEHAFALVQSNADAFRDGLFLNITMGKVRDIYEPEIFLESLNIVSCLEGYEQDIAKTNAVRSTIIMMGKDTHNPRSQILGCKVLANLAHDLEVCKYVGKVNGIQRLIDILKRKGINVDVIIEVCRTLANLAFRCKPNKEIMINEKSIEEILLSILSDKSNEKLVNSALRAIRNIVSECEDYTMEETLLQQVIDAMTEFPQGLDVQINGIWILVNLMSGKVDVKRRVVEQGAIDHILSGMETHESDPHVQLAGATALALLSKVAVYRQVIARKGGIQLLIVALRQHRQIVPIQRAVIKAIFRLSFNEQNRIKLGELKIVNEIIESMKVNHLSGPLQRISILCLMQLAKNPKLREIIQTKAVNCIIQARNKFSEIPHIYRVANMAVEVMVSTNSVSNTATGPKAGTKEKDSLQLEYKDLHQKITEKDKILQQLQTAIDQLGVDIGKLKEGVDLEALNEAVRKIASKKEINKLKQQKAALAKEIKKTQGEISEVSASLETVHQQLKDEEKKGHRKTLSNSGDRFEKKPEKKDPSGDKKEVSQLEKKKNASKHGSVKKGGKDKEKVTASPTKPNASKRNSSLKGKPPKQSKNKNSDSRGGTDTQSEGVDSNSEDTDSKPSQEEDAREDKVEKQEGHTKMSLTSQSNNSLRTINRKLSCSINTPISTEEISQLTKHIEEIQNKILETEKELEESNEEKSKVEAQVNKLNTDLKGTHILIQTLQKESLNQTHNREKMVTGNSFFTRHQKKLKSIKDEITSLEAENEELKKEIAALGGDVAPSVTSPPITSGEKSLSKKKRKH